MRAPATIAVLVALLAAPGAARAEGRPDLAAQRAQVTRLDTERASVDRERASLQARLDTLAAEIARLKARRDPSAPLFTDPELDRRLKAAQALSERLDGLTRKEDGLTGRLRAAARALLAAYDAAIATARNAAGSDPAARATLARLEAARRAVAEGLARLSPSATPGAGLPKVNPASDDPNTLEAQADLLRDTRDRLARRLADLKTRATQMQHQKTLAGQMNGLLGENQLFDESDRTGSRLTPTERQVGGTGGGSGDKTSTTNQPGVGGGGTGTGGTGGTAGPGVPGGGGNNNGSGSPSPTAPNLGSGNGLMFPTPEPTPTRAGASASPSDLGPMDAGASLDQVRARMKRLKALIHHLDHQAAALDAKAKSLTPR